MTRLILAAIFCSICSLQAVNIPFELYQKIEYISQQIEINLVSQHGSVEANIDQQNRNLFLLYVQPLHFYILTQSTQFIPVFSEFYAELVQALENYHHLEYSAVISHIIRVQNRLLFVLEKIIWENCNDSQLDKLIEHIAHLYTIIYQQNHLILQHSTPVDSTIESLNTASENPPIPVLRIEELLQANNWTLTQLAKKVNLSLSFVGNLKKGKRGYSIGTLQRLAAAFDINIKDLFVPSSNIAALRNSTFSHHKSNTRIDHGQQQTLRVEELLNAKQWTTYQLAEKTGLSRENICRIKKGKYCCTATLQKLAIAFNIQVEDLFTNNAE